MLPPPLSSLQFEKGNIYIIKLVVFSCKTGQMPVKVVLLGLNVK